MSDMISKDNGIQHKILNIGPMLYFVQCIAHNLNLVVNDAVLDAAKSFDLMEHI